MEDCATAAVAVLDALGVAEPVDWLGNAWGGHVGIAFAARWPERCRTLVTVGTPVHAYSPKSRAKVWSLLVAYRFLGPAAFLRDGVVDTLLSPRTLAQDPGAVHLTRECFSNADRAMLSNAIVSISLRRRDLTPLLSQVQAPTLFITGADHPDWTPDQARKASQMLPQGAVSVLNGAAYLGPLETPGEFARLVRDFWATHGARSVAT
jgi:pimeloyl-ACP methyl ester carboxylesterase